MFKKMTIASKLTLAFIVMMLMIAILAGVSRFALTHSEERFTSLLQHESRLIEQVGYARLGFLEIRKLEGLLTYEIDDSIVQDAKNSLIDLSERLDSIQVITDKVNDANLTQLSNTVQDDLNTYNSKFTSMSKTPKGRERMLAVAQVRKAAKKLEGDLSALNLATKSRMTKETMATRLDLAWLNQLFLAVIAAIMVFGTVMLIMIPRSIKSSLKVMTDTISHIQRSGDFSHRAVYNNKDEVGVAIQELNQLLMGLEKAISEANHVVGSIANADFEQRVTGQYVGDLERLKQGINASATSVSFMMNELSKVMNSLNAGKFDLRMSEQVPLAFRNLVEIALLNIQRVLDDINQVADQMRQGKFDARVQVDAHGDLLRMKESFNDSMEHTASVIRSIVGVVEAQALGDLTKRLPSGVYSGQFHELKNAMTYSAEKVTESIIQVIEVANNVHDAAVQVAHGSSDLSGRVQEQAAALEQTSASMDVMAQAVQFNTDNAKKVAELAYQVQSQTGSGVEVMQQTIEAMQSIKASSSKIADIVTLIDGIAFQTNLLALNAAVEAARAGEHGRGFAVVAGEVRALAQKSADAAKDIKTLINDSVMRIEVGTQLADKSGEVLNGITDSIANVATMVEQIARDSNEQLSGIDQVHKAIADIDKVTQENAALVEETSAAAESLNSESERLKENMSFFNVGVVSVKSVERRRDNNATPHQVAVATREMPKIANTKGDDWQNF